MAMNKTVVRRMIKRLESVPESYNQRAYFVEPSREAPCGAVACLAGEAVICSERTVRQGVRLALRMSNKEMINRAQEVLGLSGNHGVFDIAGHGWPEPFRSQIKNPKQSDGGQAPVAVAYLKEALKRGTMIWDAEEQV